MIVNVLSARRFWHTAKILPPPPQRGWSILTIALFGPLSAKVKWKMLVGTVVVCHFIAVASMLSTFAANVLVFICWVFLVYAIHCNFGSQKWHFLADYFIGNRFDFVSNLFPVSSEPSLYYRGCLSLFQQLFEKHGALPNDLSCKNVNTLLFSIPGTALGCAAFWASVVGCPINQWASVWCKSRFKIIENKKTIYCGRCYTAWFRSDIS